MSDEKLKAAFELLVEALKETRSTPKNRIKFAALSKAHETSFEYC